MCTVCGYQKEKKGLKKIDQLHYLMHFSDMLFFSLLLSSLNVNKTKRSTAKQLSIYVKT